MKIDKHKVKDLSIDFFVLLVACCVSSFSVVSVMIPNGLTSGGLTGIVRIVQNFVPVDFSILYYCGVAIILLLVLIFLGWKEVKKMLLLSIMYPTVLMIFEHIPFQLLEEKDIILAAVFCGVFSGTYVGLVFWRGYASAGSEAIAKIFNVNAMSLKMLKQKSVILITQPLSEDGIISEEEKIALYNSILTNYKMDEVVIKPHPREKTNWANIFPGTPIITRQVPAELLSMMVEPKNVCTFFSTAAFSLCPPEKVDIYSKDFSKLVFSHPGKNMGTVPYVDIEKVYGSRPFNWKRIPLSSFYRQQNEYS